MLEINTMEQVWREQQASRVEGPHQAAAGELLVTRAEEDVIAGFLEVTQAVQDAVVFLSCWSCIPLAARQACSPAAGLDSCLYEPCTHDTQALRT
jgi:hypothetical protein